MIDDKKIEEAANKHIETEYARYNSGEVEEEMICLGGKDSFKAGAKWAINEFLKDLWHPSSEEPKRHSYIMFKTTNNNGFGTEYIDCSWKAIARCLQITQWLYIDDLLPKKGGEQ